MSNSFSRMMRYGLFLSIIVLTFSGISAQQPVQMGNDATHFQIGPENQPIDFLVLDTTFSKVKPILLFCQGSLPIPLFANLEGHGLYLIGGGMSNFDLDSLRKVYYPVVISMPFTPLVVEQAHLNPSFCYVPNPELPRDFSPDYLAADTLENYVDRALMVLGYLRQQTWVYPVEWVVAGHSQGAKVATKVASASPWISRLGLFSPNPFGRIDQFIRETRLDAQLGRQTWEQADTLMDNFVQLSRLTADPQVRLDNQNLASLWSFSEPMFDDWLALEKPIYLAYGTEDRSADLCDIIPLLFIRENKENLTMRRYIHREHNFFPVGVDGRPDQEQPGWPAVMNAFLEWAKD